MILIIYAHPYPQHSHANKRMLEQAGTLEGVEIRSLYQLYPDFNIDVAAEQAALARRSGYLAAPDAVACRRC
jgi:glutathione-regulated potassium-efflux system ancillary protein KefF